ncbi:MAG TPA: vitamin B12-dependent ribonucleotide reductase [Capsulimonadaceae bacterium]|nr:vitamin B12-dependent ribonucleotide reductase [Capsulimonadaceae bacterium]
MSDQATQMKAANGQLGDGFDFEESAKPAQGGALFAQEEVDSEARHPADTPVGGFPAPRSLELPPERETLNSAEAVFSDDDVPAASYLEEDPFAENAVAHLLADEPEGSARNEEPAPAGRKSRAKRGGDGGERKGGLKVARRYTTAGEDVWKTTEWELRTAQIVGGDGKVVFQQDGVEVPKSWSQMATNVVASKYFRGQVGTLEREYSVRQLIGRVADTFLNWGKEGGYFASDEDAAAFHDELRYILLHQLAAFNSPVWFNLGWPGRRQAISACYINEVTDNMESILDLYKTEGMLFKDGSGSGVNLSTLRASNEPLAAGGRSSGPVSFMKGLDASAGSIKSGGSTRRAACMRVLDVDHPDVMEFINCKKDAEEKAHALIEAGYSGAFNVAGGAYDTVPFQNANHSVRVTDDFMQAVENDEVWSTKFRMNGKDDGSYKAREIVQKIAEATWVCGDPGMQYDTTINDWHTCANTDRIYASNPCSEYMFLNSTACNLASLNLMQFRHENGAFDTDSYQHAVRIVITAMEIGVGFADYPTPKITQRSYEYRTLGLGYANLGALLMASGLPYDSDAGRAYAASVTAIMTGTAYAQSAAVALDCGGPFAGYAENRAPMLRVMGKHREAVEKIDSTLVPQGLLERSRECWDEAIAIGEKAGFRNAQASVLAPTGTIGFLMDCDTTGVEPDIAIVKYKSLVGGGLMKIVNQTVPEALRRLGYSDADVQGIIDFIDQHDTIEGAPALAKEHLPIFDCAFRPTNGTRTIHYKGHIKMMAAVQPFLSGAISKTVNVPEDATAEEIAQTYMEGWKWGLKAIAIYRDGSKKTQPHSTKRESSVEKALADLLPAKPVRKKLPDERPSVTHKFSVGGHEGYITVGLYPDTGMPGEIFVTMSKEGSTISGLMDGFATAISLALQYGVPLSTLVDKFIHTRFEPSGFTNNKEIPMAKSVMDYIFRWLALKFMGREERHNVGLLADQPKEDAPATPAPSSPAPAPVTTNGNGHTNGNGNGNGKKSAPVKLEVVEAHSGPSFTDHEREIMRLQSDAPPCPECGALCIRSGACYKCLQCGTSLGCS